MRRGIPRRKSSFLYERSRSALREPPRREYAARKNRSHEPCLGGRSGTAEEDSPRRCPTSLYRPPLVPTAGAAVGHVGMHHDTEKNNEGSEIVQIGESLFHVRSRVCSGNYLALHTALLHRHEYAGGSLRGFYRTRFPFRSRFDRKGGRKRFLGGASRHSF